MKYVQCLERVRLSRFCEFGMKSKGGRLLWNRVVEFQVLGNKRCRDALDVKRTIRSGRPEFCISLGDIGTFWTAQFSLEGSGNPFLMYLQWKFQKLDKPNPLRKFYELCQPRSAKDFFGLEDVPLCHPLAKLPPAAVNLPWRGETSIESEAHRQTVIGMENVAVSADVADAWGWQMVGPVSEGKLRIEEERLRRIFISIRDQGFQEAIAPPLRVDVLISENATSFFISDGQHRLAALAALGYESVQVGIRAVITPRSVAKWPAVRHGSLTIPQALSVFDTLASRRSPEFCTTWLNYSRSEWGSVGSSA